MTLQERQARFAASLHRGLTDEDLDAIYRQLKGDPGVPRDARLRIYRGNVMSGRIRALEMTFPACMHQVGRPCFHAMCRDFIAQTPCTSSALNHDGRGFPDFIAQALADDRGLKGLPYLADLARLEFHWHALFFMADTPTLSPDSIARLHQATPEMVSFRLSPNLILLRSRWPVDQLLERFREPRDQRTDQQGRETVDASPVLIVVERTGPFPALSRLSEQAFAVLSDLRAGFSLATLAERHGENLSLMPRWLENGWITDVHLDGPSTQD